MAEEDEGAIGAMGAEGAEGVECACGYDERLPGVEVGKA